MLIPGACARGLGERKGLAGVIKLGTLGSAGRPGLPGQPTPEGEHPPQETHGDEAKAVWRQGGGWSDVTSQGTSGAGPRVHAPQLRAALASSQRPVETGRAWAPGRRPSQHRAVLDWHLRTATKGQTRCPYGLTSGKHSGSSARTSSRPVQPSSYDAGQSAPAGVEKLTAAPQHCPADCGRFSCQPPRSWSTADPAAPARHCPSGTESVIGRQKLSHPGLGTRFGQPAHGSGRAPRGAGPPRLLPSAAALQDGRLGLARVTRLHGEEAGGGRPDTRSAARGRPWDGSCGLCHRPRVRLQQAAASAQIDTDLFPTAAPTTSTPPGAPGSRGQFFGP